MPEMTSDARLRVYKWEFLIGLLLVLILLAVLSVGFALIQREQDIRLKSDTAIRAEIERATEIRSIENCNEIERVKSAIRGLVSSLGGDQIVRKAVNAALPATPGGTFVNERGEIQWRGCGEFPDPLDSP